MARQVRALLEQMCLRVKELCACSHCERQPKPWAIEATHCTDTQTLACSSSPGVCSGGDGSGRGIPGKAKGALDYCAGHRMSLKLQPSGAASSEAEVVSA